MTSSDIHYGSNQEYPLSKTLKVNSELLYSYIHYLVCPL